MNNKETQRHSQYLRMAKIWSENSYCTNLKVGALIVKDGMIISDGYNGTPSGMPNQCEDGNCKTHPYVLHAEANAITKLCKFGGSSNGADMYCTHSPCIQCAKLIVQAGIKRLIYIDYYKSDEGVNLLLRCGIDIIKITI